MVDLGGEQRLPDHADNHLLAIPVHLAESACLAHRADHARRQHVEEVLCLAVGVGAVAAMSFGLLLRVLLARRAVAARFGLRSCAGHRIRIGRRLAARRVALVFRILGVDDGPAGGLICRGVGSLGDLCDRAGLSRLGAIDEFRDQRAEQGIVVVFEPAAFDSTKDLAKSGQRDVDSFSHDVSRSDCVRSRGSPSHQAANRTRDNDRRTLHRR